MMIISWHESCVGSKRILQTLSGLIDHTWLIRQMSVLEIAAEIAI